MQHIVEKQTCESPRTIFYICTINHMMLLLFSGYHLLPGLEKSYDLTLGPEKLLEFSVNEL